MKSLKLSKALTLMICLTSLIALTGCSTKLNKDFTPTKSYQPITLPPQPNTTDLAIALTQCIADRELLYLDFERIQKTEKSVNRKFYQFWR